MRRFWLVLLLSAPCVAEVHWIRSRVGSLDVMSDAGNKTAFEMLGEFEEFRYAFGATVGKPDIATRPPLCLVVTNSARPTPEITMGRDRFFLTIAPAPGILPAIEKNYLRLLMKQNVARLPDGITQGIEAFFSTVEVHGVHVVWGTPPAPAERTLDWARIHLLATKPEYYGKLRVLLFNLQNGIEEDPAFRNAIGKSASEFAAEADAYFKRGVFAPADAPSRPLNAQRDFKIQPMNPADVKLAAADRLNDASQAVYEDLLKGNAHGAEANEGLGLLALRRGDTDAAKEYFAKATDAGTENAGIWVEFAKIGPDRAESVARALELDSKNAEAHYLKGLQKDDPEELKAAAKLEPRNVQYWDALAQSYVGQRKYPEAAKAWRSAEQASTDVAERETMRGRWASLEGRKLDFEDAERKRIADEKQRETDRLKGKALAELHAAEAKINGKSTIDPGIPVVAWDDIHPIHFEGTLMQVDCLGLRTRVVLEGKDGRELKLAVRNRRGLTCGPQKARTVALDYDRKADTKLATAGELETFPQ